MGGPVPSGYCVFTLDSCNHRRLEGISKKDFACLLEICHCKFFVLLFLVSITILLFFLFFFFFIYLSYHFFNILQMNFLFGFIFFFSIFHIFFYLLKRKSLYQNHYYSEMFSRVKRIYSTFINLESELMMCESGNPTQDPGAELKKICTGENELNNT